MTNKIVILDDSVLLYEHYISDDQWERTLAFPRGGLKLVKLTQSEYDALAAKDDNTVYFIGDSNGYTMKIGNVNVN